MRDVASPEAPAGAVEQRDVGRTGGRGPSPALALPLPVLAACWLGNPLLFTALGALTVVLALARGLTQERIVLSAREG